MKAYWGSRDVAPRIRNVGTIRRPNGQLHAPAALPQRKVHLETNIYICNIAADLILGVHLFFILLKENVVVVPLSV
jgi:hypothetical protein